MVQNSEVFTYVSNMKQEVEEGRGIKRSYVDHYPEYRTPSNNSSDNEQTFGFSSYLKEEPQDDYVELIEATTYYDPNEQEDLSPPTKRRGRPPGSTTRPVQPERSVIKKRVLTEKTVFTYPMIVTMAMMNSPQGRATVPMMYDFALYHFPGIDANSSWKNTLRHALSYDNGFEKETFGRSSFWHINPSRRAILIRSIEKIIEEFEYNKEALMMRNIDDLPALLAGKSVIPLEARVHEGPFVPPMRQQRPVYENINEMQNIQEEKVVYRKPLMKVIESKPGRANLRNFNYEQTVVGEVYENEPRSSSFTEFEKPKMVQFKSPKIPPVTIRSTPSPVEVERSARPAEERNIINAKMVRMKTVQVRLKDNRADVERTVRPTEEKNILNKRVDYNASRNPTSSVFKYRSVEEPRRANHKQTDPMDREEVNEKEPYFYIIPAEHSVSGAYWIPYPDPTSSDPIYSNPWQPADQAIYIYGGPQEY